MLGILRNKLFVLVFVKLNQNSFLMTKSLLYSKRTNLHIFFWLETFYQLEMLFGLGVTCWVLPVLSDGVDKVCSEHDVHCVPCTRSLRETG